MSLRSALMAAVSRQQRGLKITPGARFVRGRRLVTVTDVEAGAITYRDDVTDDEVTTDRAGFCGLLLQRLAVDVVEVPGAPEDLLTAAWALASTSTIPVGERWQLLADLYVDVLAGRSGTEEERLTLGRWMLALMAGREPTRDAPSAVAAVMSALAITAPFLLEATEKPPEAPEGAPFGLYAWAPRREAMPEEPDNEMEDLVYLELRRHFASTLEGGVSARVCGFLRLMLQLGWYAPVLHAPPQDRLYRGIKLSSLAQLQRFLGVDEEPEEAGSIDYEAGVTFTPEGRFSTSWSALKNRTREFSGAGKRGYAVTLVARVAANPHRFLAGPGGLYQVRGLSRHHLEKESVGLEPVQVTRVEWLKLPIEVPVVQPTP